MIISSESIKSQSSLHHKRNTTKLQIWIKTDVPVISKIWQFSQESNITIEHLHSFPPKPLSSNPLISSNFRICQNTKLVISSNFSISNMVEQYQPSHKHLNIQNTKIPRYPISKSPKLGLQSHQRWNYHNTTTIFIRNPETHARCTPCILVLDKTG